MSTPRRRITQQPTSTLSTVTFDSQMRTSMLQLRRITLSRTQRMPPPACALGMMWKLSIKPRKTIPRCTGHMSTLARLVVNILLLLIIRRRMGTDMVTIILALRGWRYDMTGLIYTSSRYHHSSYTTCILLQARRAPTHSDVQPAD